MITESQEEAAVLLKTAIFESPLICLYFASKMPDVIFFQVVLRDGFPVFLCFRQQPIARTHLFFPISLVESITIENDNTV